MDVDAAPADRPTTVVEVTDQTFMHDVVEESRQRPVVVDFWAAWCRPCRMIGPVLERLAEEHAGAFLLAKLDVDANPQASAAFRIQGIPAVKAFRDGQLVSEFVGAIPEQSIRQFLQQILPSEADRLVERAAEAEREAQQASGDGTDRLEEAERLYRRALEEDTHHSLAGVGLGRVLLQLGRTEEARDILGAHRPDPEAERLLAALAVSEWGSPDGGAALGAAERAASEGRWEEALDGFLRLILGGGPDRDTARDAMLKVFAVLGEEDPRTSDYRRRLAAALY
jgi:putative thioredoxin